MYVACYISFFAPILLTHFSIITLKYVVHLKLCVDFLRAEQQQRLLIRRVCRVLFLVLFNQRHFAHFLLMLLTHSQRLLALFYFLFYTLLCFRLIYSFSISKFFSLFFLYTFSFFIWFVFNYRTFLFMLRIWFGFDDTLSLVRFRFAFHFSFSIFLYLSHFRSNLAFPISFIFVVYICRVIFHFLFLFFALFFPSLFFTFPLSIFRFLFSIFI